MINTKNYPAVEYHPNGHPGWKGIILYSGVGFRVGTDHLVLVLPLVSLSGDRIRLRCTLIMDKNQLTPIEPLEVPINKDWLLVNSSEVVELRYPERSFWDRVLDWLGF